MTTRGATIGIDLGTTYSLAAVLDGRAPRVLPNSLGETLTPSAVSVTEDGTVLVGAPARARAVTHPERTALWFKRDMGTDRTVKLGARVLRPEELSALVLAELKRDAETALGQPVAEAVVTVPAYFGELQRRATRDACQIAGLNVERIVNEPTAAALAYGLHERDREARVVVLDLGGGTFDVTVLEIIEGVVEIQASAGDPRLGGEDFADILATVVARRIEQAHAIFVEPTSRSWARLREASDQAKRRLTTSERTTIALPDLQGRGGKSSAIELDVTRDEAETCWRELLERIRTPIRRALRDADVRADAVDDVILVGGATRMPCMIRLASEIFGKLPLRNLQPDEAVAHGAAIQAALKAGHQAVDDMVVTDVAPFSLGIATADRVGGRQVGGLFSPILERGTVLPTSRVEAFRTMGDGQRKIEVAVYQGEHSLCAENTFLGKYSVSGIPKAPAGEQEIEVRFSYDLNGILEVDTTVVATGKTSSLVIESAPGRLSRADVERARAALQRLKFHPRDALPNVTALNRAEALYIELIGVHRAELGGAISNFRGALETQDPRLIDESRSVLVHATRALSGAD